MYQIKNFTDNDDMKVIDTLGAFSVIEYQRDLSVMPNTVAGNGHYWEPNWPSGMRNEKISSIIITYTDGTKERIFDDNVNLAFWEE